MSVESFDPSASPRSLDEAVIQALCQAAPAPDDGALAVDGEGLGDYAFAATHPDWAQVAPSLSDDQLNDLIRLFTVAEMQLAGWEAQSRSPVITLVRELKARGRFDASFGRWIKQHTTNKFLPHGSLMDRL